MPLEFIYSFRNNQLLWDKHCSRHWGNSHEETGKRLSPCRFYITVKVSISDINTYVRDSVILNASEKAFKWRLRFLPLEMTSCQAEWSRQAFLRDDAGLKSWKSLETKAEYLREEPSRQLHWQMQREDRPMMWGTCMPGVLWRWNQEEWWPVEGFGRHSICSDVEGKAIEMPGTVEMT